MTSTGKIGGGGEGAAKRARGTLTQDVIEEAKLVGRTREHPVVVVPGPSEAEPPPAPLLA